EKPEIRPVERIRRAVWLEKAGGRSSQACAAGARRQNFQTAISRRSPAGAGGAFHASLPFADRPGSEPDAGVGASGLWPVERGSDRGAYGERLLAQEDAATRLPRPES